MTTTENQALDAALCQGFLVCRRDQRTLQDQFSATCAELDRPMLRVERHPGQSQVVLHWHQGLPPLTAEQQQELRQLLQDSASSPGLLPIVFRGGAYSAFVTQEQAENLAQSLALWVQDQFFRRP